MWRLAPTFFFLAAGGFLLLAATQTGPRNGRMWALGWAMWCVAFVVGLILNEQRRRVLRRVVRADYRLCPDCLYPFGDDSGRCPECGRDYTLEEVREVWRPWIDWVLLRKRILGFNVIPSVRDSGTREEP